MARATTNKALLAQRNKQIVEKFHHYYNVKRLRYDDVLFKLKWDHFYLSETFIHRVLRSYRTNAPKVRVVDSKRYNNKTVFEHRNEAVKIRFNELHEVKRIRLEDSAEALKKEFFIEIDTLNKILFGYEKYKPTDPSQTTIDFE